MPRTNYCVSPYSVLCLLLTPYSVLLTPCSSLLTPYSLLRTPYSSLLTPCSLLLAPHSLLLGPCSSLLTPYTLLPLANRAPPRRATLRAILVAISAAVVRKRLILVDIVQRLHSMDLSALVQDLQ